MDGIFVDADLVALKFRLRSVFDLFYETSGIILVLEQVHSYSASLLVDWNSHCQEFEQMRHFLLCHSYSQMEDNRHKLSTFLHEQYASKHPHIHAQDKKTGDSGRNGHLMIPCKEIFQNRNE